VAVEREAPGEQPFVAAGEADGGGEERVLSGGEAGGGQIAAGGIVLEPVALALEGVGG
jgi:hypothetical protein